MHWHASYIYISQYGNIADVPYQQNSVNIYWQHLLSGDIPAQSHVRLGVFFPENPRKQPDAKELNSLWTTQLGFSLQNLMLLKLSRQPHF